jgi:hypothetical protein
VNTIKNITNSKPIEIIPPEIIFKDIEPNYTYEITVLVRNLTKKPRRIRIGQPKTSNFRCDYDMVEARAAGIPMKLVVSFETSDLGEREFFYDQLIIKSGDNFREEIDLYAYKPSPVIVFEPFINLGFVQIGESKSYKILFKNEGMLEDKITLKLEGLQDVVVDETYFSIPPKKSREIMLTYNPKEAGIFRGTIEVDCSG